MIRTLPRPFFHFLLVWLLISPRPAQADHRVHDRLVAIMHRLSTSPSLTPADRDFVVSAVDDRSVVCRHQATLTLIVASKQGQFPKNRLLRLLERKTGSAEGTDAFLFAQDYLKALGLPAVSTRPGRANPRELSGEERSLVVRSLTGRNFRENVGITATLVPKRGLNAEAYRWCVARVKPLAANGHGPAKQYWQFLLRTLGVRNPIAQNPLTSTRAVGFREIGNHPRPAF